MLYLLTQLYPIRNDDRLEEIKYVLQKNIDHRMINSIIIFLDGFTPEDKVSPRFNFLRHSKISMLDVSTRPTYKMFFDFANNRLKGHRCMICNSDVYFDETLGELVSKDLTNKLVCLTRYNLRHPPGSNEPEILDIQGDGGSHDAWIFDAPIKDFQNDIVMGVNGCDSYLAQKAGEAYVQCINPCFSVILRHLHHTNERNSNPDGLTYWGAKDYGGCRVNFER